MNITKPPRLRAGDVIGICAPAGPLRSRSALEQGIGYLERLGYRVRLSKNLFRRRGYLAGTDAQRAADLHELFADRQVKAIFAARGGYGTQRILPLLDYSLIRRHPKIVVGYSDITVLSFALLAKARLASLAGPLAVEMPLAGEAEAFFWRTLTSATPLGPVRASGTPRLRRRRNPAPVTGRLLGGNLSLVSALAGSPFFPDPGKIILFLEEIDERPYRIDRMLQHLSLAGVFDRVGGLLLGNFTGCLPEKGKDSLTLRQVFGDLFSDAPYPVVSGLRHGHVKRSLALPLGIRAAVHASDNTLQILESFVA